MGALDVAEARLANQCITGPGLERPQQVVAWMGVVQAQDYAAAKWAIGMRMRAATDDVLEQAFAEGRILRTHMMRPTWHFVAPEDIRWILELTSPRVHAANAHWYRRLGLNVALFKRSEALMRRVLQGGKQMTRTDLARALEKEGIATEELRFAYLTMHAELEGVLCSGARRGKQFTYALLEDRAPRARRFEKEAALAELVWRYFVSHGPATLNDFCWWSCLTLAEAKRGVERLKGKLYSDTQDGRTYWFVERSKAETKEPLSVCLLPNFDEYIVGYTDRSAVFNPAYDKGLIPRNSILSHHTILLNGQVAGTWRRTLAKRQVFVELSSFEILTGAEERAVRVAAERYAAFLSLDLVLV